MVGIQNPSKSLFNSIEFKEIIMKKIKMKKRLVMVSSAIVLMAGILLAMPVAAKDIPREETLIVRMFHKITTYRVMNPYLPTHQERTGNDWNAERLMYLNWVTGKVKPWLATGFEYGPNGDTMTLKLRKGVKWSDGETFNADDVVFTYNMVKEHAPKLRWSKVIKEWYKEVRKVDDYTVFIKLKGPNPRLHYQTLTGVWTPPIVPEHIWSKIDPTTFTNYPNPVWTGPYKLVSATAENTVWERNDNYWAKDVMGKFPGAKFINVTGTESAEKMMIEQINHRMDVWSEFTKSQVETVMAKNKHVVPWFASAGCTKGVFVNHLNPPLDSPEVRWAISYAINRNKANIVTDEGANYIPKLPFPNGGVKWTEEYKDIVDKYDITKYDPAMSESIFKERGYKKGSDGIWVTPDGNRLNWVIIASNVPGFKEMAQSISDDLKAIGIDAAHKAMEYAPFAEQWNNGEYDMASVWNCSEQQLSAIDPQDFLASYHSKWLVPRGEPAGQGGSFNHNSVRYSNPEFDRLVDQLNDMSTDSPAGMSVAKNAMKIWMQDLPVIPVLGYRSMAQTFDTLYWKGYPSAENPYSPPFHWEPGFLHIVLNLESTGVK